MPTDIKLNQLIINQLTQEQYDEAKAAGTLSDTELYITNSDDDPQVKSNLSQTIDDSTTKYPSNKAVKDESSRITTLMNNYVDKTSKQNISGVKTITGDGWNLYMQSNSISYDTAPSSWLNKTIAFTDKNNGNFGAIEVAKDHENINNIYLNVFGPKGSWCPIPLGLRGFPDGSFGSTAPKCNWDNSIVTTVSHGSNHVRFGNGLQICWFYPKISVSGDYKPTITLPIPFKDSNYLALVQQTGESPSNEYTNTISILSKTTTNFGIRKSMKEPMHLQVLCVGYWY